MGSDDRMRVRALAREHFDAGLSEDEAVARLCAAGVPADLAQREAREAAKIRALVERSARGLDRQARRRGLWLLAAGTGLLLLGVGLSFAVPGIVFTGLAAVGAGQMLAGLVFLVKGRKAEG